MFPGSMCLYCTHAFWCTRVLHGVKYILPESPLDMWTFILSCWDMYWGWDLSSSGEACTNYPSSASSQFLFLLSHFLFYQFTAHFVLGLFSVRKVIVLKDLIRQGLKLTFLFFKAHQMSQQFSVAEMETEKVIDPLLNSHFHLT